MDKFKIENVKTFGKTESIIASGYPMRTEVRYSSYSQERADKLANNSPGTGHNNWLKGVVIQADITAPQYWWLQWGRYSFADIVSSQSKMHRITEMNLNKQCNQYVDKTIIQILRKYIDDYNKLHREDFQTTEQYHEDEQMLFQKIISNCPMGLVLTARITTNYLQEKTVYQQRRNHKLEEWQKYCDWLKGLPKSGLIIGGVE